MNEPSANRRIAHPHYVAPGAVLCLAVALIGLADFARLRSQGRSAATGVTVSYQVGPVSDTAVLPAAALFVAEGTSPTPFLPPGPFSAELHGQLSVDLRDEYHFRAEVSGSVRVVIGDAVVIDASGSTSPASTATPVRLNRGPNRLRLTYTSPSAGDAYLRMYWSSAEFGWEPIPLRALSTPAAADAGLERSRQLRAGRNLLVEYRCTRCHEAGSPASAAVEMDAPSFDEIGSRRHEAWMARWIANPRGVRPDARMPRLLHGPEAAAEASDIAAYLATRRGAAPEPAAEGDVAAGEEVFTALHCRTCHDTSARSGESPPIVSLDAVREKFIPGALAEFLLKPHRHYAWIAMPDFKLTAEEAADLAAWLESTSKGPLPDSPGGDAARGEVLVQGRGCMTCHASTPRPDYAGAKPFPQIAAASWSRAWHDSSSPSAAYDLTSAERAAMQAFAGADLRALTRETPAEFAEIQLERLNCAGCHDTVERIPRLDVVGGKLRPQWAASLLDGSLPYKPRPWLEARMPAFPAYAERLAAGLAAQHGYAATAAAETAPVDSGAADVGRQMVASGGCANCHNVGEFVGSQSPSTAGINFVYTAERLRYAYFHRWMLNPPRIWPGTVMPRYFSGGKGAFPHYDGNVDQQIRAFWEYLRLGSTMPAPQ